MRLNPDKARHVLARSRELAGQREHERWLAAMTPEHRNRHEHPIGRPCFDCIQQGFISAQATVARMNANMAARREARK